MLQEKEGPTQSIGTSVDINNLPAMNAEAFTILAVRGTAWIVDPTNGVLSEDIVNLCGEHVAEDQGVLCRSTVLRCSGEVKTRDK